jgi:hypothetical protein
MLLLPLPLYVPIALPLEKAKECRHQLVPSQVGFLARTVVARVMVAAELAQTRLAQEQTTVVVWMVVARGKGGQEEGLTCLQPSMTLSTTWNRWCLRAGRPTLRITTSTEANEAMATETQQQQQQQQQELLPRGCFQGCGVVGGRGQGRENSNRAAAAAATAPLTMVAGSGALKTGPFPQWCGTLDASHF